MKDESHGCEILRTKVIKEYALAISNLETLYYKNDASDIDRLIDDQTRKISKKSDNHRWMIHALQEHGLRGSGVFLSFFIEFIGVSRSAALYILKNLIKSKLVYTYKAKNNQNRMVTCYRASQEMIDSYLEFTVYVFKCAKRTKVVEKFNKCAVVDEIMGLEAQ